MLYDAVVVGTGVMPPESMDGHVLYISEIPQKVYEREQELKKEQIDGIILELRNQQGVFELVLYLGNGKLQQIHTKKIVLTTYSGPAENSIISLYEVLWAANVVLDSRALTPIVNECNETSLQKLYFYPKQSAL